MELNQTMESNKVSDEISLKELISILLKNKILIIAFTIIAGIIAGAVSFNMNANSKEAKLLFSINHGKIYEGQNPDGSKFEPYEIASPYILSDAIKHLKLEDRISTNDIRKNIVVEPLIPERVTQEEEFTLAMEGKGIAYYPNQFLLRVKTDKNAGIDSSLAMRLTNQIIDSYITNFSEEYISTNPVVNKIITFSPEDYDYSDISMVFHDQLDTIISYNSRLREIDPEYRSKNTGLSFNDIIQSTAIIDEIDLNRIDSMISSYQLTKDKDRLILYYEYLIEQLEFQKSKSQNSANISTEMLGKIDNTTNKILIGLSDGLEDTEESYFSDLILKSSNIGSSIATLQEDIEYYKNELEQLKAGDYLTNVDGKNVIEEVESIIDSTFATLQNWIDITNETSSEFYGKLMTRAITPLSPAEVYGSVNLKLNIAIGLMLGLMLGVFIAFFNEYWKKA